LIAPCLRHPAQCAPKVRTRFLILPLGLFRAVAPPVGLTTVNASSVVGTSRDSQTSNRRSMLLNAGLFGDFGLSTLICWRSTRISASSRALDRNSPVSAHPSSKRKSIIVHEQIKAGA